MQKEIAMMITTIMKLGDDYNAKDAADAIESFAQNWPSLTDEEKREIKATVQAYKIVTGLSPKEEVESKEKKR